MRHTRLTRVHKQLPLIDDLHADLPFHDLTYYRMRAVAKVLSEGQEHFLFRFTLYARQYLKLNRPQELSGRRVERAFERLGYLSSGGKVLDDILLVKETLPTEGKIVALGTTRVDHWAECLQCSLGVWEKARVPVTNGYYLRASDLFVARRRS